MGILKNVECFIDRFRTKHIAFQVVGRGYQDDAQVTDPKPSTYAAKARERRRPTKSEYACFVCCAEVFTQTVNLGTERC